MTSTVLKRLVNVVPNRSQARITRVQTLSKTINTNNNHRYLSFQPRHHIHCHAPYHRHSTMTSKPISINTHRFLISRQYTSSLIKSHHHHYQSYHRYQRCHHSPNHIISILPNTTKINVKQFSTSSNSGNSSDSNNENNNSSTNTCSSSSDQIINYFSILDIPEEFDINMQLLQTQFQLKMREYHPDKHAMSNENIQKESALMSSRINMAKTILESPLWRAQHLLYLMSINDNNNNNNSGNNENNVKSISLHPDKLDEELKIDDQFFLMEIMEIRLEIEDASSRYVIYNNQLNQNDNDNDNDDGNSDNKKEIENKRDNALNELYKLKENNENTMKNIIREVSDEFGSHKNNENGMDEDGLERIRDLLAKLIYYWRIDAEIKEKLPAR